MVFRSLGVNHQHINDVVSALIPYATRGDNVMLLCYSCGYVTLVCGYVIPDLIRNPVLFVIVMCMITIQIISTTRKV